MAAYFTAAVQVEIISMTLGGEEGTIYKSHHVGIILRDGWGPAVMQKVLEEEEVVVATMEEEVPISEEAEGVPVTHSTAFLTRGSTLVTVSPLLSGIGWDRPMHQQQRPPYWKRILFVPTVLFCSCITVWCVPPEPMPLQVSKNACHVLSARIQERGQMFV